MGSNNGIQTIAFHPGLLQAFAIPSPGQAAQPLTGQYGQNMVTPQGAIMTSDLTSPVVENALIRYQVQYYGAAIFQPNVSVNYQFDLQDRRTSSTFRLLNSALPRVQFRLSGAGQQYRVVCRIQVNNVTVATVSLDHDTVARDPAVAALFPGIGQESAARAELIEDFRQYVIDAATATGAEGITPLFLASLLRIEITNTPLGPLGEPRLAREEEIAVVENALQTREKGGIVIPKDLNRSIGVGQIKPSTAAMIMGETLWIEQDPNNRKPARDQIDQNYQNLSVFAQRNIVTKLRWPKSNIKTAADLVARYKNRQNRFPGISRTAFGTSQQAVEIIATEYNLGASNSSLVNAQPAQYGKDVWKNMQDTLEKQFFPNT